jgi:hypothetical protein
VLSDRVGGDYGVFVLRGYGETLRCCCGGERREESGVDDGLM